MATPGAERQRAHRLRKAGLLPEPSYPTCEVCKGRRTGSRGNLCAKCWRKTPEGREWQKQRMAAYRQKKAFLIDIFD